MGSQAPKKGEGSTQKGLEGPSRPRGNTFGGRVRVWPAPTPTPALTLGDPLLRPARSEAWPGVPGGAPGRPGAERCSPAMCWRRASSRCVDSTSPMARRSRGPIGPLLLRRTPLAPWSPQAPRPPPRSPAAAWAPLCSRRDPSRVPAARRCCHSSLRPGPGARPAPPRQAPPPPGPRPPLQSGAGGDL